MSIFNFRGVRLLPNEENAYIQRTDVYNGINFDALTIEALTPCGTVVADLTENFEQIQSFDDPETGFTQIYWGLKNLPDLGNQLIYLRITNGADGYAYSTPFAVYGLENENDVPPYRFDYRDEDTDVMQSIGLELYYYRDAEIFEQESYDTVGGDSRIVLNSKLLEYEICRSAILDYKLLREFKRMMCFSEKYCDYEAVTLIGDIESRDLTADENFTQYEVGLLRDSGNIYDPNFVPPVPPIPPVTQTIVLQKVVGTTPTDVTYTFVVNGFTPNYLTYQYSLDGTNWIDGTGSPTSPFSRTVPNYTTKNYYYRITARPAFEVDSNVVQLSPASITLNQVYSLDPAFNSSGNRYLYDFQLNNFTPTSQLSFDISPDNVFWILGASTFYQPGNESPKLLKTGQSGVQMKYFRIRYTPLNLTSNVYNFQF